MFRPCIDIKGGKVVQLEQGARLALTDSRSPAELAAIYLADGLAGGHVIDLEGGRNRDVILPALSGRILQVGGGVRLDNGRAFLDAGAAQLIFSSAVFKPGGVDWEHLAALVRAFGRERIVLAPDVKGDRQIWVERWRTPTGLCLDRDLLGRLGGLCAELLIHSIEVEGMEQGMDLDLVRFLAEHRAGPVVYAGGGRTCDDVRLLHGLGLDLTIGKAYFAGRVSHDELVRLNRELAAERPAPSPACR